MTVKEAKELLIEEEVESLKYTDIFIGKLNLKDKGHYKEKATKNIEHRIALAKAKKVLGL